MYHLYFDYHMYLLVYKGPVVRFHGLDEPGGAGLQVYENRHPRRGRSCSSVCDIYYTKIEYFEYKLSVSEPGSQKFPDIWNHERGQHALKNAIKGDLVKHGFKWAYAE